MNLTIHKSNILPSKSHYKQIPKTNNKVGKHLQSYIAKRATFPNREHV